MADDFHGTYEWEVFMASMPSVFPDRPVVDIENKDAIFHVLYDLDERFQVPGVGRAVQRGTYEQDGIEPALARHLRRQGPHHGGHLPQHGPGRRLGVGRRPGLSGAITPRWPTASESTTSFTP